MNAKTLESKALVPLDFSDSEREATEADADATMVRAAELAVRLEVDLDGFMQDAHAAYMKANPVVREHFETMQWMAHLDELRRRGVLATA